MCFNHTKFPITLSNNTKIFRNNKTYINIIVVVLRAGCTLIVSSKSKVMNAGAIPKVHALSETENQH